MEQAILLYKKALVEKKDPKLRKRIKLLENRKKKMADQAYLNPELAIENKTKGNEYFKNGKFVEAVKEYTDGNLGHEVHQYLIDSWGHNWPTSTVVTGFEASEVIWEFFDQFVEETTSVERIVRSAKITVFPNPVSTDLNVRRSGSERAAYQIISAAGAEVTGGQLAGQSPQIDVAMLPQGLYVLMLDGEAIRFTK